tara:strand:- start:894 stop:1505 length:612 start_codon:yes stop_codon:yes gene_type:complete
MQKTPHHFKRKEVKDIINKVLKDEKITLKPLSISTKESLDNDLTTTSFCFIEQIKDEENRIAIEDQPGKGFIDGLFTGLHDYYEERYKSLKDIKLFDLKVNPILSGSKTSIGTDAQAAVLFCLYVKNHGAAEFQHRSRSMIYSSYVLALEAFQFYINCEKAFHKIKMIIKDAESRNRSDISSKYIYDLTKITEVNNYEERQEG